MSHEPNKLSIALKVGTLFVAWILLIVYLAGQLPPSDELKIPHSLADLKLLVNAAKQYSDTYPLAILMLYCTVFLFKQTWGIPGAALLNILAGALFGFKALPLISFLGATGSSIAYLISKHWIGQLLVGPCISKQSLRNWKLTIKQNEDNLLVYLATIRILPLFPGWFVNFAAPLIGVPLDVFWMSTFIGLTPFHYVCVSAATTLAEINSLSEIFNFWTIFKITSIGVILLLTAVFKDRLLQWIERFKRKQGYQTPEDMV
ncbi:hypothetical protein EDD86DRAFT_189478 [Gorgonomyces haynaldii]|nr:hypothetical protein EDD86DRAFT_189478 [Gorgonomyces haynaldii]